jgi:hypothetical protein
MNWDAINAVSLVSSVAVRKTVGNLLGTENLPTP